MTSRNFGTSLLPIQIYEVTSCEQTTLRNPIPISSHKIGFCGFMLYLARLFLMTTRLTVRRFLLACLAITQVPEAFCRTVGNVGTAGYVDPTFNCPATTTCPLVCAARYEECPTQMRCPEPLVPCADGSCATFCSTNLVSPCTKECLPVACPHFVTTYDVCLAEFEPWYTVDCVEQEESFNSTTSEVPTWVDLEFVLVYSWVMLTTFAIVSWSWYK